MTGSLKRWKCKYDIYMNGYLINYECVFPIDGSFKALFTVAAVVALIIILTSVYCIKNSFNISITEKSGSMACL